MAKPLKKQKKTRDPERTEAKILVEAGVLFAKHGFHAAPISEIVSAAGVTQRMAYHYFGSKKGLYRAVLRNRWKAMQEWIQRAMEGRRQALESAENARSLVLEVVGIISDFFSEHQDFVRLLMWDSLEETNVVKDLWAEVTAMVYQQAEGILRMAQEDGALSGEILPAHLITSILGAMTFYFAAVKTLPDMIHADPLSPESLRIRREQLQAMVKNLLHESNPG
jgi:TetR/AcrR family transcriptional regulator